MKLVYALCCMFFLGFQSKAQDFWLHKIDEEPICANQLGFKSLFEFTDTLKFNSVLIKHNDSVLFSFLNTFGDVRIERNSNVRYLLFVSFVVPYNTIWKSTDLLNFEIVLNKDFITLKHNEEFIIDTLLFPDYSSTMYLYHSMKEDSSFTTTDWEKIGKGNYDSVKSLVGQIFLCAVSGNENCYYIFLNLEEDFNMIYAGYLTNFYNSYLDLLKLSKQGDINKTGNFTGAVKVEKNWNCMPNFSK